MHNVYKYNRTVSIDKKDIFKSIENDALILEHFSLLSTIKYLTEERRDVGTILQIILNIKGKLYRFKSKITSYNEPDKITIETYTKYGTIYSALELTNISENTVINIKSEIDNLNFMTKAVLKIMHPILKIAFNKSINNFLIRIETINSKEKSKHP